tara:strand:- start:2207 stop:2938 length:732 start_codon:yes stop_codon:yes gene_type:complete
MSNEHHFAENRVFESIGLISVKASIKAFAKEAGQAMAKAIVEAGAAGAIAKEVAERVAKEVAQAIQKAGDEAIDAALKAGKTMDEATQAAQKAMKKAVDDFPFDEGIESGAKTSARRAGKESLEEGFEAGVKGTLTTRTLDTFKASLKNPFLVRAGGATAIGLFVTYGAIRIFGDEGIIAGWIAGATGADCDERAIDAGHDEGTEEYEQFVLDCQKRAERNMTILGISAIVVVGLTVFAIIKL